MSYITTKFEESVQSSNRLGIGNHKTIQILGYIRVLKTNQNSEPNRELQEKRIREYADLKGYRVKGIYLDECNTMSLEDRPQLQKLLSELQARNPNRDPEIIVTYSLCRLSKNIRDAYTILDQIKSKKSELICLDIDLDLATPLGKLMFNTKLSISQFQEQSGLDPNTGLKTIDL
jgi:DNA invertase Pin-like site-specific DNA recombinase